jgi:hypothetical protein
LADAERLAADFPEPAVGLGWTAIEQELTSGTARLGLSSDFPSPGRQIETLRKAGQLDDETYEILRRMRNLRNMAVHGSAAYGGISSDEVREFLALAAGVVRRLREISLK